jgi:Ca2+/H+ antiporter, TMEM165/GDT1 family
MNMIELGWTHAGASVTAAFLASLVEFIEALTVVLAVGAVRGWRGSLTGAGLGVAVLVALTAALGPALTRIPLNAVQLVVGVLLLLFGLRWLRKAMLRAGGIIPLHDETAAYAKETAELRRFGAAVSSLDGVAVAASFKIVMLEGIEVVFIVIAIGARGDLLMPAAAGAGLALVLVIALGFLLHRPVAMVPENTLKFIVGVLLTAFGTFWLGEGMGAAWPAGDWSLLALVAGFFVTAVAGAGVARAVGARGRFYRGICDMRRLKSALTELIALFVDDGSLVLAVIAWLVVGAVCLRTRWFDPVSVAVLLALGIGVLLLENVLRSARNRVLAPGRRT